MKNLIGFGFILILCGWSWIESKIIGDMEWINIMLMYKDEDTKEDKENAIAALNNFILNIHPKKSISSVWYRTISYTYNKHYYEVLAPRPSETNIMILKDFGYKIGYRFVTRKERREFYKRLKR